MNLVLYSSSEDEQEMMEDGVEVGGIGEVDGMESVAKKVKIEERVGEEDNEIIGYERKDILIDEHEKLPFLTKPVDFTQNEDWEVVFDADLQVPSKQYLIIHDVIFMVNLEQIQNMA